MIERAYSMLEGRWLRNRGDKIVGHQFSSEIQGTNDGSEMATKTEGAAVSIVSGRGGPIARSLQWVVCLCLAH
jgi:hypothetical protein